MIYSSYGIAIGVSMAIIGVFMSGASHGSYPKEIIYFAFLGIIVAGVSCVIYMLVLLRTLSDKD